jgi:hypothetical protein
MAPYIRNPNVGWSRVVSFTTWRFFYPDVVSTDQKSAVDPDTSQTELTCPRWKSIDQFSAVQNAA